MGAIIKSCCEGDPPKLPPPVIDQKHHVMVFSPPKTEHTTTILHQSAEHRGSGRAKLQEDEEFYDIDTFVEQREKSFLQPERIKFSDFEVLGKFGQGSFGVVLQVSLKSEIAQGNAAKYAMKRIPREKVSNNKTLASVKLEREILAKRGHAFITNLNYAFADKQFLYLVMQSAEGGDVGSLLSAPRKQSFKALGETGVKFISACVVLGLEYLHSQNVLYRDLKAQNILIFGDGYAKLSDFGLAKVTDPEHELSKTHAGTALYNPPQMVLQLGYNRCADFWALGVLIFQLQTGETPFKLQDVSTKLRFKRVAQEEEIRRKWRGHHLKRKLQDLIAGLLKFKPEDRLGVRNWEQIKKHPYFDDLDWNSLQQRKMKSPLLPIIQANPIQVKYFKPIPRNISSFDGSTPDMQGWDYDYKGIIKLK